MKDKKRAVKTARKSRLAATIFAVLVMISGVCLLMYPIVMQYRSAHVQEMRVGDYDSTVLSMQQQQRNDLLARAQDYNTRLRLGQTPVSNLDDNSFEQDTDYMSQLSVGGMVGSISIPKISVVLPIYHGTSSATLSAGVGHLYGTSLPIGGKGTNSVLAGHRGLPNALIFTRLDELGAGDTFSITVLGETHTYQVDATWVVEPDDTSHFTIDPSQDYVTLLTCTPYGVNTQRLLVRGVRVTVPVAAQKDTGVYPVGVYSMMIAAIVAVIGIVIISLWRRRTELSHANRLHAAHRG